MKIGLLPLYIKLYYDNSPKMRPRLEEFYEKIAKKFEERGVEVVRTPFCRLEDEFRAAVGSYEQVDVDAIVTLHMAYSPSLMSIKALTETKLPIVVLDTTETLEFTPETPSGEISYNHGIHGVMDMCSMLARYEKPYAIVAGHYEYSDVIERALGYVRAAIAAKNLSKIKCAILGDPFCGMGDFSVPDDEMKRRFGIEVLRPTVDEMKHYCDTVTDEEIDRQYATDLAAYEPCEDLDEAEYRENIRARLAVFKMLRDKDASAFTVNFSATTGLPTMPFIAACEGMRDGIGYAGEGDTLTSSFVGAFLTAYPETNFVEIFCPDWKNNVLFLSHMGETNYRVADLKPTLSRKKNKYGAEVCAYSANTRMMGGRGVYVNISRKKDDFMLLASECEMLSVGEDNFKNSIRGWMKPAMSTAEFLEEHSRAGATHHSLFIYGATEGEVEFFGQLLGMDTVVI